jgi:hypothetical protein
MKSDKEFCLTLADNIRHRGAMSKRISDRARVEIRATVEDLLRALCIEDWQSKPYHEHQIYAERRYATAKSRTNVIMNRSGAPASTWLLCMEYVCYLLNHLATESIGWRTPLQLLTGETTDISTLMHFHFWQLIFFMHQSSNKPFPSQPTEEPCNFVGIASNVGDAMTFIVLSTRTNKILYRSSI